ncbi:unnamed protein product [Pseudo-nitzschia multistriata]|uniref:Uncharacterized protein n=1 Tax=Pseudo-nitzschia multistriata TaxID=183589 RepID=A0A448Z9Z8_9STRA|nr:unnamed protein product [Pseudo-nitzschia multistriata]
MQGVHGRCELGNAGGRRLVHAHVLVIRCVLVHFFQVSDVLIVRARLAVVEAHPVLEARNSVVDHHGDTLRRSPDAFYEVLKGLHLLVRVFRRVAHLVEFFPPENNGVDFGNLVVVFDGIDDFR